MDTRKRYILQNYRATTSTKAIHIAKSHYQNLAKSIVDEPDYSGLDGTTCEISFGGISTEISYRLWSPDYETKKNLNDFMEACKIILMTVKLDPKEIL